MSARPRKRRHIPRDRRLRELVFTALAESSNAADPALADMAKYVLWIKTGVLPGKSGLQVVAGGKP